MMYDRILWGLAQFHSMGANPEHLIYEHDRMLTSELHLRYNLKLLDWENQSC